MANVVDSLRHQKGEQNGCHGYLIIKYFGVWNALVEVQQNIVIRFCLEVKRVFLCGIFSLTSKYERVRVGFVFVCLCIVAGTTTTRKQSNFEKLCPADQDKVRQIVQIMDRFSISIEVYHELSQVDARFKFYQLDILFNSILY